MYLHPLILPSLHHHQPSRRPQSHYRCSPGPLGIPVLRRCPRGCLLPPDRRPGPGHSRLVEWAWILIGALQGNHACVLAPVRHAALQVSLDNIGTVLEVRCYDALRFGIRHTLPFCRSGLLPDWPFYPLVFWTSWSGFSSSTAVFFFFSAASPRHYDPISL